MTDSARFSAERSGPVRVVQSFRVLPLVLIRNDHTEDHPAILLVGEVLFGILRIVPRLKGTNGF